MVGFCMKTAPFIVVAPPAAHEQGGTHTPQSGEGGSMTYALQARTFSLHFFLATGASYILLMECVEPPIELMKT